MNQSTPNILSRFRSSVHPKLFWAIVAGFFVTWSLGMMVVGKNIATPISAIETHSDVIKATDSNAPPPKKVICLPRVLPNEKAITGWHELKRDPKANEWGRLLQVVVVKVIDHNTALVMRSYPDSKWENLEREVIELSGIDTKGLKPQDVIELDDLVWVVERVEHPDKQFGKIATWKMTAMQTEYFSKLTKPKKNGN